MTFKRMHLFCDIFDQTLAQNPINFYIQYVFEQRLQLF